MCNGKILVIDDDHDIREVIKLHLKNEGFTLLTASNGMEGVEILEYFQPDLIILDVMMPGGIDGFETCQKIRERVNVPIIFLSASDNDIDQILGLRIGGDDYMTKPFNPAVLTAKVKAYLRRYQLSQPSMFNNRVISQKKLEFPGLTIDLDSAEVKVNGTVISLSAKELHLLSLLASHPNKVFNVEHLFEKVWGEQSLGDHRTVMVHISNLRKKIEADPSKPKYISTVRGIGYKFNGFQG